MSEKKQKKEKKQKEKEAHVEEEVVHARRVDALDGFAARIERA